MYFQAPVAPSSEADSNSKQAKDNYDKKSKYDKPAPAGTKKKVLYYVYSVAQSRFRRLTFTPRPLRCPC